MELKSDAQLLREYAETGADAAFAEIVARHTNLVYSAALRQVRTSDLAADVAQNAFLALLKSAPNLTRNIDENASLAGWLCRCARNISLNLRRDEFRRHAREREAMEQFNSDPDDAIDWGRLAPVLDEAMSELNEPDYDALVLRFFKNNGMNQIGQVLGVSEDAAQKRVGRALEKLKGILAQQGIRTSATALGIAISANAVGSAPVTLVLSISTAASIAGTIQASTAIAATKVIAMTTLHKALIGGALAAAIGTGIYQVQKTSSSGSDSRNSQAEQNGMASRLEQLRQNRQQPGTDVTVAPTENGQTNSTLVKALPTAQEQAPRPPAPGQEQLPEKSATTNKDLPKDSWADVGFATPEEALRTRGWAVAQGSRERFKDSVLVTESARQTLEDMFVKMAEASTDPNKAQFIQQVLDNDLAVEDGLLMPMMAENRQKGYVGYRIVSQQALSDVETLVQLEIQMTSSKSRQEQLKLRRIGPDWKVVIDDDFLKAQGAKR